MRQVRKRQARQPKHRAVRRQGRPPTSIPRTAKDRLRYAFTVSAPGSWDQPWGGEYEFAPLHGVLYEYACNEGNYALPGILAGARTEEKEALATAKAAASGGGETK